MDTPGELALRICASAPLLWLGLSVLRNPQWPVDLLWQIGGGPDALRREALRRRWPGGAWQRGRPPAVSRRSLLILRAGGLILTLWVVAFVASAQSPPAPLQPYVGDWLLNASASDNIEQAIQKATAPMNFISRSVARSKLRKRNAAFPALHITSIGDAGLRIRAERGLDVSYEAPERPVKTHTLDGADLTTAITNISPLTVRYQTDEGVRVDTYRFNTGNAGMTLEVVLTSPRLPQPVTYSLRYHR